MVLQVKQNLLKSKVVLAFTIAVSISTIHAQYAPSVGQIGTKAIHQDSSVFVAWAISCELVLGDMDVADPSGGKVNVGSAKSAEGKADGLNVVSLGDGGSAILTFEKTIKNGVGADFAVFENGFGNDFLELAFVEVSSDGINFVRFPATSLTQSAVQVASYGTLVASKLNNLAGKYRAMYGTPFDLDELKDSTSLNINAVTHVKIIDVVGSIDSLYASYDKDGNIINDPYPTNFASGGFDLDAVGVIHESPLSASTYFVQDDFKVYPNPVRGSFSIVNTGGVEVQRVELMTLNGNVLKSYNRSSLHSVTGVKNGLYLLRILSSSGVRVQKIIVSNE